MVIPPGSYNLFYTLGSLYEKLQKRLTHSLSSVFLMIGLLGEAPLAAGSLPTEAEEEEEEPALDDMQRRLEALKS